MADYNSQFTGAQIDEGVGKGRKLPDTTSADSGKTLQVDSNGNFVANTVAGGMSNPMTTQGDIIVGGSSGTPTRLAKGAAGQVLTMNSGATTPEWQTPSGGGGTQLYRHNISCTAFNSNTYNLIIYSTNNTLITTREDFGYYAQYMLSCFLIINGTNENALCSLYNYGKNEYVILSYHNGTNVVFENIVASSYTDTVTAL